ncbi:unnamed protein product [Microthlaspi erraticum]|uniref:Signal peptidase complex subunit 2 n=1 Tax=Microthlaspi erraticum TaxID=1685480 RepID=A0A6D2IV75_9BRAS|nr:unnamed protein product [Microthlaspi erraticum]
MEEKKAESTNKNAKKANLLDHHSIKHILDESVSEIVTSRGYREDVRLSNLKLILGVLILYIKEKNAILFTYPPEGSFTSTGLVVSSNLPRFSDLYTLTIDSADPKSISAGKSVNVLMTNLIWVIVTRMQTHRKMPKEQKTVSESPSSDAEALVPVEPRPYGTFNTV